MSVSGFSCPWQLKQVNCPNDWKSPWQVLQSTAWGPLTIWNLCDARVKPELPCTGDCWQASNARRGKQSLAPTPVAVIAFSFTVELPPQETSSGERREALRDDRILSSVRPAVNACEGERGRRSIPKCAGTFAGGRPRSPVRLGVWAPQRAVAERQRLAMNEWVNSFSALEIMRMCSRKSSPALERSGLAGRATGVFRPACPALLAGLPRHAASVPRALTLEDDRGAGRLRSRRVPWLAAPGRRVALGRNFAVPLGQLRKNPMKRNVPIRGRAGG